MVIRKKAETIQVNIEEQRLRIIEKGADVSSDRSKNDASRKPIMLKIPESFLEKIDSEVSKRVGLTRTAWILQAIQKQLENE
jgi:hypothetical protein